MKLAFTTVEIAKLDRVRAGARALPNLQREIILGKESQDALFKAVTSAWDLRKAFLPSQVLAGGERIEVVRRKVAQAEFAKTALLAALQETERCYKALRGDLQRDVQELTNALEAKIKAAFPGGFYTEQAARALQALGHLPGADIAARGESLITPAAELGLQIPEESA